MRLVFLHQLSSENQRGGAEPVRNCSIGNSARAVDPAPERRYSAMGFEKDQPVRVSNKVLLLIVWHLIIYSYYLFLM